MLPALPAAGNTHLETHAPDGPGSRRSSVGAPQCRSPLPPGRPASPSSATATPALHDMSQAAERTQARQSGSSKLGAPETGQIASNFQRIHASRRDFALRPDMASRLRTRFPGRSATPPGWTVARIPWGERLTDDVLFSLFGSGHGMPEWSSMASTPAPLRSPGLTDPGLGGARLFAERPRVSAAFARAPEWSASGLLGRRPPDGLQLGTEPGAGTRPATAGNRRESVVPEAPPGAYFDRAAVAPVFRRVGRPEFPVTPTELIASPPASHRRRVTRRRGR
jgi:hypothetical protein